MEPSRVPFMAFISIIKNQGSQHNCCRTKVQTHCFIRQLSYISYEFHKAYNFILLQKNPLDALISQIYFWNKTLRVSDSSSVHHQEFFTVHTAVVYIIQVCWQLASSSVLILLASCQQTCMIYTTAVCTVKNSWWWTEELSETRRVLVQK